MHCLLFLNTFLKTYHTLPRIIIIIIMIIIISIKSLICHFSRIFCCRAVMVLCKTGTGSEWNGLDKIFFMPCLSHNLLHLWRVAIYNSEPCNRLTMIFFRIFLIPMTLQTVQTQSYQSLHCLLLLRQVYLELLG